MERQAEIGKVGDGASGEERLEAVESILTVCAPVKDRILQARACSGPAMAVKFFM